MRKVLKAYTSLAHYVNKDIKVIKGTTDWCSYPELCQVEVPQLVTEQGEQAFLDSVARQLPADKQELVDIIPDFMWSFLHEIGHIQCKHNVDNYVIRGFVNIISKLGWEKMANKIYFNLKEEKQATKWAVDFVMLEPQAVEDFTKKILKRYEKYYKKVLTDFE